MRDISQQAKQLLDSLGRLCSKNQVALLICGYLIFKCKKVAVFICPFKELVLTHLRNCCKWHTKIGTTEQITEVGIPDIRRK
jgi:hypothetical protein